MPAKYLTATIGLCAAVAESYLRLDHERTGGQTDVEVSRLHDAHGRVDPDACVISGETQQVMFAIGILAANGEDCLLRVEAPCR